jgi:hypothetical protein
MKTATEPVDLRRSESDLIDRIAAALPEGVRAEYYRELRHCRTLPESDEMLRLLRAMQFLVLLIQQAPARVAQEREHIDKLLASAIVNFRKVSEASEAWHAVLDQRLTALPAQVAHGIRPEVVAGQINENLRQEFIRSTIPKTADALGVVSERMKKVCSEFIVTADQLGNTYRGAAEDARQAIASLSAEVNQASRAASSFTAQVSDTFSKSWRTMLAMIAVGALALGVGLGMTLEHWLLTVAR